MRFKSKFSLLTIFFALVATTICSAAPIEAKPNKMPVYISEKQVNVQAYNINDENYFKLRDIAMAFADSEHNFEVLHSSAQNAIYISTASRYTSVGGEMSPPSTVGTQSASPTTSSLYINGLAVKMTAYNINYNNYYRLKDLGARLDFSVEYDPAKNTVLVDCPPLVPEKPTDPVKPTDPEKPTDPTKPTDPPEPPKPKSKIIAIDAGHGGSEPGSINKTEGITESLINYEVAERLAQKLRAAGYEVVMLRGDNQTLSLTARMEILREMAPHLLVSVHHNATEKHNAYGAEVIAQVADKSGGKTKRLAELIGREYIKIGQTMRPIVFKYNSTKTGDYYGLLRACAAVGTPAIISEFAFLDHPNDIAKINSPDKLALEADALYTAVINYLQEFPPAA